MTDTILRDVGVPAEEPLPWHKPEVKRLSISSDTESKPSQQPISQEDFGFDTYGANQA